MGPAEPPIADAAASSIDARRAWGMGSELLPELMGAQFIARTKCPLFPQFLIMPAIARLLRSFVALLVLASTPVIASAQADEIQVYQGALAKPGTFNLTVHNNYTLDGIRSAGFQGGVVPDKSLNGVPEFAYGVNTWLELGLYLPLYTLQDSAGFGLDGFKLRALVAAPDGDNRKFVYGLGFELGFNARQWDTKRVTSEFRPIIGWHFNPVDLIFNPIFDTSYEGGLTSMAFVPSTRLAYNASAAWALAVEEYADFGVVRDLHTGAPHQLFGVIDHAGKTWDVEVGAGVGLTDAADKFTLKLIVARDLHHRKN
jgi:hypothetical protein